MVLYLTVHGKNPVEVRKRESDGGVRMSACKAELIHFGDCIRSGKTPVCSGEKGERAIQIAEAPIISDALGLVVELPLKQIDYLCILAMGRGKSGKDNKLSILQVCYPGKGSL